METLHFHRRERGGRLVEKQHLRRYEQRLDDLEELPLAEGETRRPGAGRRPGRRTRRSLSAAHDSISPKVRPLVGGSREEEVLGHATGSAPGRGSGRPSPVPGEAPRRPGQRAGAARRSRPRPRRARGTPLAIPRSVDFPDPFSPTTAWTSPARHSMLTSATPARCRTASRRPATTGRSGLADCGLVDVILGIASRVRFLSAYLWYIVLSTLFGTSVDADACAGMLGVAGRLRSPAAGCSGTFTVVGTCSRRSA